MCERSKVRSWWLESGYECKLNASLTFWSCGNRSIIPSCPLFAVYSILMMCVNIARPCSQLPITKIMRTLQISCIAHLPVVQCKRYFLLQSTPHSLVVILGGEGLKPLIAGPNFCIFKGTKKDSNFWDFRADKSLQLVGQEAESKFESKFEPLQVMSPSLSPCIESKFEPLQAAAAAPPGACPPPGPSLCAPARPATAPGCRCSASRRCVCACSWGEMRISRELITDQSSTH